MNQEAIVDLSAFASVLKDIEAWEPELQPFLSLDYQRIERIVASRGISFIMIEMPDGAKIIDQALSRGRLWADMLPNSFGSIRHGHRKLFRCLTTKVFDDEGFLRDNVDTRAVFFLRQVLILAKKTEEDCSYAAVEAEVDAFRQIDESLYRPSLNWLGDELFLNSPGLSFGDNLRSEPDLFSHRDQVRPKLIRLVEQVADAMSKSFPPVDWRQINPRHGKGAVADAKTGTDKYLFPTWSPKLEAFFPQNYYSMTREDLAIHEAVYSLRAHEPPVRLMTVPKTLKAPRMIASEPASHQFLQLGLMQWIRDNMPRPLRSSIDFSKQLLSQVACLEASKTGDMATVDLSAASDRLSCWTVERIFRANPTLLEALHACRSRWLTNATKIGEPYNFILKKYAPMGNGTTFPVQSIVYAILSIASILYEEGLQCTPAAINSATGRIRVYGDDIILPSSAVPNLVLLLEYLQLKVNRSKTFSEGHFRESCGMDAFMGVDVTPVKMPALELSPDPESLVSWCDVSKGAASKGLFNLSRWMESKLTKAQRELLPRTQGTLGCMTLWNYFPGVDGGRRRYNRSLYRHEVLALTSQPKNVVRKRHSDRDLLQYFTEAPAPDSRWEAGFLVRKRTQLRVRWVPVTVPVPEGGIEGVTAS